jgi:hypothetical protein
MGNGRNYRAATRSRSARSLIALMLRPPFTTKTQGRTQKSQIIFEYEPLISIRFVIFAFFLVFLW